MNSVKNFTTIHYLFAVKLDGSIGSCNTLNDLSNKICVPNKTEDLKLSVFNMITEINESKTLAMKTLKLNCTTKQKLFQQISMKRKQPVKRKIFIFYLHFYQLL